MEIRTLKDYIDSDCRDLLVFESPVALTSALQKFYVVKDKPSEGTRARYFDPIPLHNPSEIPGTETAPVPVKQHLDDKVVVDDQGNLVKAI